MADAPSAFDLLQAELAAGAPQPAVASAPTQGGQPTVPTGPAPVDPYAYTGDVGAGRVMPGDQPGATALQDELARQPGPISQGVRDVVQGAATMPGLVYDGLGNLINLGERGLEGLTGADLAAFRIHPAAKNIDAVLDAAGLPTGAAEPNWQSRVIRAAAAPLGGGLVGSAIGAAAAPGSAAEAVGSALTAAPTAQVAGSVAPEVSALYTDDALKDHPLVRPFANAAAGLAAAGSIQGLASLLNAPGLSPEIAAWAAKARDVYGIPLAATDMSQNATVRTLGSINRNLLMGGSAAHDEAVSDAITKGISNTIGENTTRVTPDVMTAARTRIGNELDRIGAATTVQADNPFLNDLQNIQTEARSTTGWMPASSNPQMGAIQNQLDDVLNRAAAHNGVIPGDVFQDMVKQGTPLDLTANNPDPVIAGYGQRIHDALFDAWERSAPPDEVQNLQAARFQWKNMKAIEPLVEKAVPPGVLSPQLITGAARSSFNDMAYSGAGQLGDLGTISKMFLRPTPDSYTALRSFLMGALIHPASIIPTAGMVGPANLALGAGLRSNWLANRMLQGGAPAPSFAAPAAMSLLQPEGRSGQ
jgi:hypothetical protein